MKARPSVLKRYRSKNFKRYTRNRIFRSVYPNTVYTASEHFAYGQLQFTAGTLTDVSSLQVNMNQLPQVSQYAALFRQFCIRHVTYTIVPRFGESDPNAQSYNSTLGGTVTNSTNIRMHYAVIDTPFVGPPGNEAAILQNNNVKTRMLNQRIFKIQQSNPKPEILVTSGSGANVNGTQVKDQWFNFTNATTSTGNGGQNVAHGNVQVCLMGAGVYPNGLFVADIYAKVTFSCRNPA